MNDNELIVLFQTGTAPERDQVFAERVYAELEHGQPGFNFLAPVKYICMLLLIVGCIILAQFYLPLINSLVNGLSESLSSLVAQIIIGVISSVFVLLRRSAIY